MGSGWGSQKGKAGIGRLVYRGPALWGGAGSEKERRQDTQGHILLRHAFVISSKMPNESP